MVFPDNHDFLQQGQLPVINQIHLSGHRERSWTNVRKPTDVAPNRPSDEVPLSIAKENEGLKFDLSPWIVRTVRSKRRTGMKPWFSRFDGDYFESLPEENASVLQNGMDRLHQSPAVTDCEDFRSWLRGCWERYSETFLESVTEKLRNVKLSDNNAAMNIHNRGCSIADYFLPPAARPWTRYVPATSSGRGSFEYLVRDTTSESDFAYFVRMDHAQKGLEEGAGDTTGRLGGELLQTDSPKSPEQAQEPPMPRVCQSSLEDTGESVDDAQDDGPLVEDVTDSDDDSEMEGVEVVEDLMPSNDKPFRGLGELQSTGTRLHTDVGTYVEDLLVKIVSRVGRNAPISIRDPKDQEQAVAKLTEDELALEDSEWPEKGEDAPYEPGDPLTMQQSHMTQRTISSCFPRSTGISPPT